MQCREIELYNTTGRYVGMFRAGGYPSCPMATEFTYKRKLGGEGEVGLGDIKSVHIITVSNKKLLKKKIKKD
jgi:hypothetical protein